jgi:hypothetical protein
LTRKDTSILQSFLVDDSPFRAFQEQEIAAVHSFITAGRKFKADSIPITPWVDYVKSQIRETQEQYDHHTHQVPNLHLNRLFDHMQHLIAFGTFDRLRGSEN